MNTDYVCRNEGLERPYGATEEEEEKFYEAHPYCVEIVYFTPLEMRTGFLYDTEYGDTRDVRFFDNFKDALIFAKTHSEEDETDGEEDIECRVIKDNRLMLIADADYAKGFRAVICVLTDDQLPDIADVFGCSVEDVKITSGISWHLN